MLGTSQRPLEKSTESNEGEKRKIVGKQITNINERNHCWLILISNGQLKSSADKLIKNDVIN